MPVPADHLDPFGQPVPPGQPGPPGHPQRSGRPGPASRSRHTVEAVDRLHLVLDADDTLWENNVLYERTIDTFLGLVDHPTLSRQQVRARLDEIEEANCRQNGYGAVVFGQSLDECYRALVQAVRADDLVRIEALVAALTADPPELIPGVEDTLTVLADQHELFLLTKGPVDDQLRKVELSGLGRHFRKIVVVPEKTVQTYRALVREENLDPARTWVIGNSPRSDVNPAYFAGLNAVLVPHPHTWVLEHDEVPQDAERVLVVEEFRQLVDVFCRSA